MRMGLDWTGLDPGTDWLLEHRLAVLIKDLIEQLSTVWLFVFSMPHVWKTRCLSLIFFVWSRQVPGLMFSVSRCSSEHILSLVSGKLVSDIQCLVSGDWSLESGLSCQASLYVGWLPGQHLHTLYNNSHTQRVIQEKKCYMESWKRLLVMASPASIWSHHNYIRHCAVGKSKPTWK